MIIKFNNSEWAEIKKQAKESNIDPIDLVYEYESKIERNFWNDLLHTANEISE